MRFLINPYLGIVCGGITFYNLSKLIPKEEYKNSTILGFVILKTLTSGAIGSIVPITCFFIGKELHKEYKEYKGYKKKSRTLQ